MRTAIDALFSARGRQWIYGVAMAAVPLLVFYGVATSEELALWAGVVSAVLSTGTALAHVTPDDNKPRGKHVRNATGTGAAAGPDRPGPEARPDPLATQGD